MKIPICTLMLGFVVFGSLSIVVKGQQQSEREELGYHGPVRLVRTVSVEYSLVDGRLKPSRPKIEIERFSRSGVRIENTEFDENKKLTWRDTPILSKGKVVGWRESSSPDEPPDEFFYKFDRFGNKIEQSTFDESGKVQNQWVYTYNPQDRLIKETHDSKVKTYTYDKMGRTIEISTYVQGDAGLIPENDGAYYRKVLTYSFGKYWTSQHTYSADGKLVTKTFLTRDRIGNEVEDVTYDGNGILKYRLRYKNEYDNRGNLIRVKTFRMNNLNGKESFQLEDVSSMFIKYHEK